MFAPRGKIAGLVIVEMRRNEEFPLDEGRVQRLKPNNLPGRKAGALTVLVDGSLVLYVERGGRTLLSWTEDPERRKEAHIPDEVVFQTKPKQALGMIKRAVVAKLPKGRVLGDTAYGDNTAFRSGLRDLDLEYALAVSSTTRVYEVDAKGIGQEKPIAVKQWAKELGAGLLPMLGEAARSLAYGLTLGVAYAAMSPHRPAKVKA